MTIVDFRDNGPSVYILVMGVNMTACGDGLAEGRCIQFFPDLDSCFAQIARDARMAGYTYDQQVEKYRVYVFSTAFTRSHDGGIRSYNVVEVNRPKWTMLYQSWCSSHRSKVA